MNEISDELLMAYADGELAGDMCVRVETYLASDPEGQQRLAAFTDTGKKLADVFERPMREPVPARLINAVTTSPGRSQLARSSGVKSRLSNKWRRAPFMIRTQALAASFAALLAVGAGSVWLFQRTSSDADSTYGLEIPANAEKIADAGLASALDAVASGKTAVRTIKGETASIRPIFSFATITSRYCRQYEIFPEKMPALAGVACREASGAWRIEVQMPIAARHSTNGMIVPAGKEALQPIEAVVNRIISGDVLGVAEEAHVMSGGWRMVLP